MHVDHVLVGQDAQRIAIRRGTTQRIRADDAAGAGHVLDHQRLPQLLAERADSVRAILSGVLPAMNGTISRIGRFG
ncbi:hypothetical protein AWV80_16030 [Cupriavidus sp. UYMU48A]|nr:hypothetical protein AWV80_16030 [Cupriavidus sp. UYMU48A]